MPAYYDYFLSYAWKDNEASSGLSPGWIDRFDAALQRELAGCWRAQVAPYRDCHKIKSGEIEAAIRAALKKSLTYVCLLSNHYFASDWCPLEAVDMFRAINANPLLPPAEARRRIVPVLLAPRTDAELGAFHGLLHVEAFQRRDDPKVPWMLLDPDDRGEGSRMVRQVAFVLQDVLKSIWGKNGPLHGHKGQVYVSASPDLAPIRQGLEETLENHGFPVLPSVASLPVNQPAFDSTVEQFLSQSRASIHALGAKAPKVDGGFTPLHREFELSRHACAAKTLRQSIVWIPQDWECGLERHQRFVEGLVKDATLPESVRVLRVSFEELKNVVREECGKLGQEETPQPDPTAKPRVYLVYRPCDTLDLVFQALSTWLKSLECTVVEPLFGGDPAKIFQHDLTARTSAFSALVFCGTNSAEWADEQYQALKAAAFAPHRLAFYLQPGPNDDDTFSPPPGKGIPFRTTPGVAPESVLANVKTVLLPP